VSDAILTDEIKELLCSWYDRNILYVSRCVSRLKDGLPSLIYAALMGMSVDISGGSRRDEEDITKSGKLYGRFIIYRFLRSLDV
jgi:hypothetical protein